MGRSKHSGDELAQKIEDLRASYEHVFNSLITLLPNNWELSLGAEKLSRAELKTIITVNDKALKHLAREVKHGVSKTRIANPHDRRKEALNPVHVFHQELTNFILGYNLGKVNPEDPDSEDLVEYLNKSPFVQGIATPHSINKLMSILVRVNNLKCGNRVTIPEETFKTKLPIAYNATNASGQRFNFANFTHLSPSSAIITPEIISKEVLTTEQLTKLEQSIPQVREMEVVIANALEYYRK